MEQLLVHCAAAIESNDATLSQQILWVLNNIAAADGDSNQRLTWGFLRALITRATKTGNTKLLTAVAHLHPDNNLPIIHNHRFSIIELASFVDLTPWHRFGFTAANSALIEAVEGYPVVHIVDISLTHCMQIPTLIDAIASRLKILPVIKLTVAGTIEEFPPFPDFTYDELGSKLVNFAMSKNLVLEFRTVPCTCSDGFSALIEQLQLPQETGEALVINCHMMLHYIPEETIDSMSLRDMFLKAVRTLNPTVVMVVDEDADFTSINLVNRLIAAYNYLWIPYDTMETFLPNGNKSREWYEADIYWKIENVVSQEGRQRVERAETKSKWVQRMRNVGFRGVAFSEEAIGEVKRMLDEHAPVWGLKKEEDEQHLVLTWKGHNVIFATAWVPAA